MNNLQLSSFELFFLFQYVKILLSSFIFSKSFSKAITYESFPDETSNKISPRTINF